MAKMAKGEGGGEEGVAGKQAGVEVPSIINSYKNTETSNKLQVFSCISAKRN